MKYLAQAALAAAALWLAGCQSSTSSDKSGQETTATASGDKDLNALFDSYWEKNSQLFPLDATAYGDNRYNDQLPNNQTRAFRDTLRNFYQGYLTRLEKFDREKLEANDKISYDIFAYTMNQGLFVLRRASALWYRRGAPSLLASPGCAFWLAFTLLFYS